MRAAKLEDFMLPQFRDKDPADYEVRDDGVCVRKDRWEMAIQRIRGLVGIGSRTEWEIADIVAAVEKLVETPPND